MLLILLTVVVLRSVLVTRAVRIHNDERHYALDGFWVKSGLSYPTIWKVLLHGHMHPHPLFNPLTGIIRPHGEFTEGFRDRKDDLATFPRAGHPPLYMIILGGVFLVFSKAWLLQGDNFVLVARALNTLLDCLTWLMMYQILRSLFGKRFSLWVIVPVALLPYVLVFGSIGYLDSPGTFMMVLCAWVYFLHLRHGAATGWWFLLGLFLGAGILMKQSNVFAFPLLAAAAWIWPPVRKGHALILSLTLLLAAAGVTVVAGCNPRDLVTETMSSLESTRVYGENRFVARDGSKRLVYLANPARHYHFGTTKKRPKPFITSPVLVGAHYATFPLLLILFVLSVIVLALLRQWRALSLPLVITLITIVIPVGSCVRRLYMLLPFVVLTIALAVFELVRRRGGAGTGTASG
jgi:hypothetical protein